MQGCFHWLRRTPLEMLVNRRWPIHKTFRFALVAFCVGCCAAASDNTYAKETTNDAMQATTSRAARAEAIRAIPFQRIDATHRHAIKQVLNDCSLYRRLPTQVVDCDPKLFTFLGNNPEALVEMWRKLGFSQVELVRTGSNTFHLADHAGTTGELVVVEATCDAQAQNRIVMYAQGAYDGKPFKRPVRAECVLLLRSGSMTETNGRDYVAARLDSFVRIDRTSIELFAKALHPWVGKTADTNFADTMTFISNFSRAAELRPDSIERLVNSLPRVTAERRGELVQLAHQTADATRRPSQLASKTGTSRAN